MDHRPRPERKLWQRPSCRVIIGDVALDRPPREANDHASALSIPTDDIARSERIARAAGTERAADQSAALGAAFREGP